MKKLCEKNVKASLKKVANTTDLSKFGFRELEELRDILSAWIDNGLPDDFEDSDVHPEFNEHSGYVFLTNSEHQAALLNDGKLETFYWLAGTGIEGFLDELIDMFNNGEITDEDDLENLKYIFKDNGKDTLVEKVEQMIEELAE